MGVFGVYIEVSCDEGEMEVNFQLKYLDVFCMSMWIMQMYIFGEVDIWCS